MGELWDYLPATSLDQALLLGAEALRLDGECPLSPGGVLGQGGKGSRPLRLSLHLALTDSTQLSRELRLSRAGLHEIRIDLPEGKSMRTAYGSLRGFAPSAKSSLLAIDSFSFARYKPAVPDAPAPEETLSEGEGDQPEEL